MFSLNLLLLYLEILIRFLSNHSDFSFISESILYLILVKETLFSFLWHIYYMLQFILNFVHAFCTSAKVIIDIVVTFMTLATLNFHNFISQFLGGELDSSPSSISIFLIYYFLSLFLHFQSLYLPPGSHNKYYLQNPVYFLSLQESHFGA